MKLTHYTDERAFEELQLEWNDLLHRSSSDVIFCTWEWQSTWWTAYKGGNRLCVVACHNDDGRLIGLAPWFIEYQISERVVRTVGCVDVTDYVDIIADDQYVDVVQEALAAFLTEHHDDYDRINLCNIPEASPTLPNFADKLKTRGFNVEVEFQEVCPVITLPDNWETYLEQLDKKQRHEIRRKLRRAEGEAALHWYVVDHTCQIEEELGKFLVLMRASHPEKAKFLEDPNNAAFFKRIVPLAFACGWLKMSFLVINGTPSAAYCNFDYDDRILVYNSGLLPEENAYLSPGIVLLSYDIRDAIAHGRGVFDFLRGNETYKYRMGGIDTKVFKLKAKL